MSDVVVCAAALDKKKLTTKERVRSCASPTALCAILLTFRSAGAMLQQRPPPHLGLFPCGIFCFPFSVVLAFVALSAVWLSVQATIVLSLSVIAVQPAFACSVVPSAQLCMGIAVA